MILRTLKVCLFILLFICISSCAHNNSVLSNPAKVKQSFVKMDVMISLVRTIDGQDQKLNAGSVASGAGVVYGNEIHVLTANHVCDYSDVVGPAEQMGYAPTIKISAIDVTGERHSLEIVKQNAEADLCLLKGKKKKLNIPVLRLSDSPPEKNKKYFNFAAPAGVFNAGVVPLYEGNYAGVFYGVYALYTIPVYPGSSGSPIVNSSGELVGMVHSVHRNFHHVSFSATHDQLSIFLLNIKNKPGSLKLHLLE
jgi:S1-C subfamily serine protease